jgi:UPF0271 protein
MSALPVPFGDAAWRVGIPEGANARAVLEALLGIPGALDAVVCERDALVTFDPDAPVTKGAVALAVERALATRPSDESPRSHVVPVLYDGVDLDDVARSANLSQKDVIAIHAACEYRVVCLGFLPGFAYLRGLDPRLHVPRRATPRPRIGPLSVAVAGPYAGVYPFASPGGWNILGTARAFTPFDPSRGAALSLGDRVRFEPRKA